MGSNFITVSDKDSVRKSNLHTIIAGQDAVRQQKSNFITVAHQHSVHQSTIRPGLAIS